MKRAVYLLALLAVFGTAKSQMVGTWSGDLQVPGRKLKVVFHISKADGKFTATMDSPDQKVTGIPATKVVVGESQLDIEVANGMIAYQGKLAGDSIQGEFRQSGYTIPLVLREGEVVKTQARRPQTPEPPFPYTREEVAFINPAAGNIRLAGTLTLPAQRGSFPAVILISGSGPQDRDETILEHKPFLVLADYLSRRGIAVLRFDDRGVGKSQGTFSTATTADFATDVEAAVNFLKSRKDIKTQKIGLIGHSEGALIAAMTASKDSSIAFTVLLAGPGVTGADLLLMQNETIGRLSGMDKQSLTAAKQLNETLYTVAAASPTLDSVKKQEFVRELSALMPPRLPQAEKEKGAEFQLQQLFSPWTRFFLQIDPAVYLSKVKCPVLVLNGGRDVQVPATANVEAIEKALRTSGNQKVTTKVFPELNHLFQHANTGLPGEYGEIEETIAPEVLEQMATWIEKQGA